MLVLVGQALLGCGVGKGASEWISSDAAVVRCTIAGRNLRLPRLLDELPTPLPPTGLYAQSLDPIALDQLGFERERAVCATLEAPDEAAIASASAAIEQLLRVRDEVDTAARELGEGCLCMHADRLGARELLSGCMRRATAPECTSSPEQLTTLEQTLAPLREQLAATTLPRVHWRLFGRTDRPGHFAARHGEIVARHAGGSEVFLRGMPLLDRPGSRTLAGLLAHEGVVALVRQDSGRALLVVREVGDVLILDHFAHGSFPTLEGPALADLHGLLGHLDDAQLAWFRAALAPPTSGRTLQLDPRRGYLIELDHAALERVDRATLVLASLAGIDYDVEAEQRVVPPLLVDRISLQVPFGSEGEQLVARMRLSDEGRRWLAGGAGLELRDALAGLAVLEQTPSFAPALPGMPFVLRGQPLEQLLFAGPSAAPGLFAVLAAGRPGSVEGEVDEFEIHLPSGPLPAEIIAREGSDELRERLSLAPHRLEVEQIEGGRVLAIELEPE